MPKRYRDIVGDGGSNILGQVGESEARLRSRMARLREEGGGHEREGGVGKSVLTANLAAVLAADGWRVGVLDADLNGPLWPRSSASGAGVVEFVGIMAQVPG